uniref:ADP-ribosylation factor-like 9 n=1 Tax=Neogobius melanostomus TaxID=47308 RepID=A0A8C6SK72_9GOBI
LIYVGGSVELRQYWHKYMPKALMLVFVVDASNTPLFPLVKTLLHDLLVADPHLPLMVLANKQDCAGACTITDLHEALSLSEVGDRKMFVIGTYVTKEVEEPSSGVEDALEFIIQTIQTPR